MANFLDDQEYADRRALTRDLTERQAKVRDDPGFIDTVAKFAAIATAGYFIGRRAVKSDAVIEALNSLGQFGRRVAEPGANVIRGMMDEFAGVVRGPSAAVRNFDLLEQVTESLRLTKQLRASGHTSAAIQGIVQATRIGLRERGFEDLERAGLSRFRAATVDDVMRQPGLQKAIGRHGYAAIKEAHEMGMVGGQTALTRGNLGLLLDPRAPGQFVDTRWASPRTIMGGAANLIRQIQVPFLGLRPGDMILAVMRPFGEGHFAGMVGRRLETAPGVRSGNGTNVVVGGRLMSYEEGGWSILSDNVRINPMGRVGQAHLERYGNAEGFVGRELERRVQQNRGGWKGMVDLLKYTTGIGKEYRTRDPVVKTALWDPLMRREHGEVVRHDWVRRRDAQGWVENLHDYVSAQERGVDPNRFLNEAVRNEGELSWWERVQAHIGTSRKASVLRRGERPSSTKPGEIPVVTSGPEYVGNLAGRRAAVPGVDFIPPGPAGTLPQSGTVPMDFYAYAGKGRGWDHDLGSWIRGQADALMDVGHYLSNRLNDLFGMTIGVGFRPSVGRGVAGGALALGKNIAKVYGIYYGAQAGLEYANYADYVAEIAMKPVVTGLGAFDHPYTSPKKMAIGAYQGVQVLRAGVKQGLGIQKAANYLEDLMPGSMSTALSDLGRTVGPVAYMAAKHGVGGLKSGLAIASLIGGSDVSDTVTDVVEEFKGEKLVPVRKSRWWVMGRQPWEGGQIDHFAPHWTVRALSDYKYTDVRYGSKDEYFTNVSRAPTPHNLFGLVPLLQEGGFFGGGDLYLAKKHQHDRPYPDTPGVDTAEAMLQAQYQAARGPYDAPMGAGQRLGYGSAGTMPEAPQDRSGMLGRINDLANELSELTGMYKFLFWDLPGFGQGGAPKMGSYKEMNSEARDFWDANLGGMLGLTELYRRFNPPEEAKPGLNPIPNTMPTWLPGSRSDVAEDRGFNVDFTQGDPYVKIQGGEYRLPGAGYEVLHRLHSGSPGVYDAMDRFLVLADIAPNSRAFTEYRTIVDSWEKAGVLDAYWAEKFKTTKRQVRDKMERYQFFDRKFTGTITAESKDKLGESYNLIERAVGGAYEVFAHDIIPKVAEPIPVLGTILSDKLFPVRSPIEHYERFQVYGEEFADWRSPWRQLVRPKLHQLTAQDPLTASTGGAMLAMFGANPVAAFTLGALGMVGVGGSSMGRMIKTGKLEGGYVPDFRQREYELQEYFDKLQYVKSDILKERADAVGDQELSQFYSAQMGRTIAGLNFAQKDQHTFVMQAMRALPRNQRAYLLPFMKMPDQAQEKMAQYMSPDVAPVFLRAAGRQYDQVFTGYRSLLKTTPEERVAAFFRQNGGLPEASWGGWHPDVPMDAIKIKMVDAGAGSTSSDIHKFDLFNEHRYRATKFDMLQAPITRRLGHVMPADAVGASLYDELDAAGFQNIRLRNVAGGHQSDDVNWNVRRIFNSIPDAVAQVLH